WCRNTAAKNYKIISKLTVNSTFKLLILSEIRHEVLYVKKGKNGGGNIKTWRKNPEYVKKFKRGFGVKMRPFEELS
ncbi:hypothetical protein L9F63_005049, partial [Diploptera punctata]